MTILTLLSDLLGSYKSFQTGEHYFTCPFCHNAKKKFAFNEHNLKWHCWHCDAKGGHVIWLLKQLNVSKSDLAKFKDVLTDVDITQYKNTTATSSLLLPPEYKPLWQVDTNFNYLNALSYLKKRGIRAEDVMRYRMGYCESGVYKNRIIIPSYDSSNTLNYFIARSFYNDPMRFMNPPVTKNIICFENMINWNLPIVLCEGVFDAITLRRNAIPLLGKTLPKNLHLALIEKKVQDVTIFLDKDATARALSIEHKLREYGINTRTVFPEDKDASELGFQSAWEQISTAQSTNFKELITQRLLV